MTIQQVYHARNGGELCEKGPPPPEDFEVEKCFGTQVSSVKNCVNFTGTAAVCVFRTQHPGWYEYTQIERHISIFFLFHNKAIFSIVFFVSLQVTKLNHKSVECTYLVQQSALTTSFTISFNLWIAARRWSRRSCCARACASSMTRTSSTLTASTNATDTDEIVSTKQVRQL